MSNHTIAKLLPNPSGTPSVLPPLTVYYGVGRPKLKPYAVLPAKPFHVAPSNFLTPVKLANIVSMMNDCLSSIKEVTFNYYPEGHLWLCYIIIGSCLAKIEIRLYCNGDDQTVIECNRLSGELDLLYEVFRKIKKKFNIKNQNVEKNKSSVVDNLSDAVIKESLDSVLTIALEDSRESKIIAAQILCDLSLESDYHK